MGLADVDIGAATHAGSKRCKVGKLIDNHTDFGFTVEDRDWLIAQLDRSDRGLNRDSGVVSFANLAKMIVVYTAEAGNRWSISLSALRAHATKCCACHL